MLKKHVIAIGVVLVSAITCGATFLLALYRPFTPVEVAASLATAVQLYLLSSSIGDLLDDKEEQPAAAGGGGGDCRSAGVLLSRETIPGWAERWLRHLGPTGETGLRAGQPSAVGHVRLNWQKFDGDAAPGLAPPLPLWRTRVYPA